MEMAKTYAFHQPGHFEAGMVGTLIVADQG